MQTATIAVVILSAVFSVLREIKFATMEMVLIAILKRKPVLAQRLIVPTIRIARMGIYA